jgi:O-antigen ligase
MGGCRMGDLQTYFYLALISGVMVGITLLFILIAVRGLRRWYRQAHGETPLAFWLIGGAVAVALLFILVGTAGVLYGFLRYGTS